jgi:hypothetical protein
MRAAFSLPVEQIAAITAPGLLLTGGSIPGLSQGLRALVEALPNVELRTLPDSSTTSRPTSWSPPSGNFLAGVPDQLTEP